MWQSADVVCSGLMLREDGRYLCKAWSAAASVCVKHNGFWYNSWNSPHSIKNINIFSTCHTNAKTIASCLVCKAVLALMVDYSRLPQSAQCLYTGLSKIERVGEKDQRNHHEKHMTVAGGSGGGVWRRWWRRCDRETLKVHTVISANSRLMVVIDGQLYWCCGH